MALNSEDTTKLEAARPTATARVQRFAKTLPPALLAEDQRIADELSRSNASPREKLARVYRLIDAFSDAAQPYSPGRTESFAATCASSNSTRRLSLDCRRSRRPLCVQHAHSTGCAHSISASDDL